MSDTPAEFVVYEEMVGMPDGVKLYTVVLLPSKTGEFPVIVRRSPYVGANAATEGMEFAYQNYLRDGYAIVWQHVRGRGRSEGEFFPYDNERADGLATLDWIRKQSFYNGSIYLDGTSYLSSVHMAYLDTCPPDVKGAVLRVQDCERYNIIYRNGFLKIGLHGEWSASLLLSSKRRRGNYSADAWRTMPLYGFSEFVFGEFIPEYEEFLLHPDRDDPYWNTRRGGSEYRNAIKSLRCPVLLVTSWYDIYTEGVFAMWNDIPESIRPRSAMVVTPYGHGMNYKYPTADNPEQPIKFPHGGLDEVWQSQALNWFNHIEDKSELYFAKKGQIAYYSAWENVWRYAPNLKNSDNSRLFYLNDGGSLDGEAKMVGAISYSYNPYAPASFRGGVCNNFGEMQIQDPPNSRYDIISFLSAPFDTDTCFEGTSVVELHCSSDCEDTCFYARLSLVKNGVAYSLRDDIDSVVRANPEFKPGDEAVIRFNFAPHAFQVGRGDSLRLDISSSCFPLFSLHTNQKGLQAKQTSARIAHNTIITGKSFLKLFLREEQ